MNKIDLLSKENIEKKAYEYGDPEMGYVAVGNYFFALLEFEQITKEEYRSVLEMNRQIVAIRRGE